MSSRFQFEDYSRIIYTQAKIDRETIMVATKPGQASFQRISPTTHLLSNLVELPARARVLLLGTGPGALVSILGHHYPDSELYLVDTSWTALRLSELTLRSNRVENARMVLGIDIPAGSAGTFDVAVIELPKGRKLARRWLLQACTALRDGGYLYLGGSNDQGIQPAVQDAHLLFNNSAVLGYKKGCRVARMKKTLTHAQLPDWTREPGIAPGTWYEIDFNDPPGLSPLASLPGVFSYDRLDEGTSLLMEHLTVSPGTNVLDLGCGYGVLGLFTAQAGAALVDLLDDNQLAVACTQQNIIRHGLAQASAFTSDAASQASHHPYHLVITNPPFHTGKAVDYAVTQAFIGQSFPILAPGGEFWMVANRFIRYEEMLEKTFGNSKLVTETGRYQVWMATRR